MYSGGKILLLKNANSSLKEIFIDDLNFRASDLWRAIIDKLEKVKLNDKQAEELARGAFASLGKDMSVFERELADQGIKPRAENWLNEIVTNLPTILGKDAAVEALSSVLPKSFILELAREQIEYALFW